MSIIDCDAEIIRCLVWEDEGFLTNYCEQGAEWDGCNHVYPFFLLLESFYCICV